MNKTHTLKELADIGAGAAYLAVKGTKMSLVEDSEGQPAREAFTKAILDAIGYEFPRDAEREAFDAWANAYCKLATTDHLRLMFPAWKAGREELRKEVCSDQCEDTITEPAWIPWPGGDKSPIVGQQTRYQIEYRDGAKTICVQNILRWTNTGTAKDIIAYRILEP